MSDQNPEEINTIPDLIKALEENAKWNKPQEPPSEHWGRWQMMLLGKLNAKVATEQEESARNTAQIAEKSTKEVIDLTKSLRRLTWGLLGLTVILAAIEVYKLLAKCE